MEMPAAWKVTFEIAAPGRSFAGRVADDTTCIREDPAGRACGYVDVMSGQPYRDDAEAEARLRVRDICRLFTVSQGVAYAPTLVETQALAGAKDESHKQSGLSVSDFATAHLTHNLASQPFWLTAANAVAHDPELASALDTYIVALGQADAATKFISLYRAFDLFATRAVNAEPELLSAEQARQVAEEAVRALGDELDGSARERLLSTITSAVARVRRRSRNEILMDALQRAGVPEKLEQAGMRLRAGDIGEWTSLRAKVGHRPTDADHAMDREALRQLTLVVRTLVVGETLLPA